jgi:hypothetical protein
MYYHGMAQDGVQRSRMVTSKDGIHFNALDSVEVLARETQWEGSEIEVLSSLRGEMPVATHELRDPYVFTDTDGQTYLLYSGSGEQALGMVRLKRPVVMMP